MTQMGGGYSSSITAEGVIPGWETTKLFTVTGTNEIDSNQTVDTNMYYKVGLVVEENTFSVGAFKYEITPDNGEEIPTGQVLSKLTGNVPQSGTEWFGMGYFVPSADAVVHKYALKISFPETGENQNIDKGKHFAGYVTITDEGERVNLNVIVDNDNPASNYNKTLLKNSGIFLEIPVKEGYEFMGWNVVSGNATVEGNKLIVYEEQNIQIEAVWKNTGYVTLVLDLNGGNSSDQLNQRVYSNSIVTLQSPTKEGYTFINWELIQGEATITGNNIELKEKNVILKANYIQTTYVVDYTGKEIMYEALVTGNYKLEVWGAQGGSSTGGYGGYSTGVTYLEKNTKIYINVGGPGSVCYINSGYCSTSGGYNGGGNAYSNNQTCGGGGGATHIALSTGLLSSFSNETLDEILIISGGGGGGGSNSDGSGSGGGGSGGGISGVTGTDSTGNTKFWGTGGSQLSGGKTYWSTGNKVTGLFGQGGQSKTAYEVCGNSGGGGGLYGGGASSRGHGGAGGGSGYIGNILLTNKAMYCYKCQESNSNTTFTVNTIGTSVNKDSVNCPNGYSLQPISKCAKAVDGYAKITYLGNN